MKAFLFAVAVAISSAPSVQAQTMRAECHHSAGQFNAFVELRPNSYPTNDVLIHTESGRTLVFDHVRGTEYHRANTNGDLYILTGSNELNFKNLKDGGFMTCQWR